MTVIEYKLYDILPDTWRITRYGKTINDALMGAESRLAVEYIYNAVMLRRFMLISEDAVILYNKVAEKNQLSYYQFKYTEQELYKETNNEKHIRDTEAKPRREESKDTIRKHTEVIKLSNKAPKVHRGQRITGTVVQSQRSIPDVRDKYTSN